MQDATLQYASCVPLLQYVLYVYKIVRGRPFSTRHLAPGRNRRLARRATCYPSLSAIPSRDLLYRYHTV